MIVGDYFKDNPHLKAIVNKALEVVKWFNNHGRALGILGDIQRMLSTTILCLILPVLTRWTSHYVSVDRLLELEPSIVRTVKDFEEELVRSVGSDRKAKAKAKKVMKIVGQTSFWMGLRQ